MSEGNPIDVRTGSKLQTETDYRTTSGLSFTRHYNSKNIRDDVMGRGWSHNLSHRLKPDYLNAIYKPQPIEGDSSTYESREAACTSGWQEIKEEFTEPPGHETSATYMNGRCVLHHDGQTIGSIPVLATNESVASSHIFQTPVQIGFWAERPSGASIYFRKGLNGFTQDSDMPFRLESSATGYQLIKPGGGIEEYDNDGRLIRSKNPSLEYKLEYGETGKLARVADRHGRNFSLEYNEQGHVSGLIRPDGLAINYSYDADNRLVKVKQTDATERQYSYQADSHRLSAIHDEKGTAYARWSYDAKGRGISSEHIGGVERVDITYQDDDSVSVTDAMGASRKYEFSLLSGGKKLTAVKGDVCHSCGAQAAAYTYDGNGYLASSTDFNGNTTQYQRDDFGLELSRTEAVGTPFERTVSTIWHPTLRLPTTITEPGRVTHYSYDADGRRLAKTVTSSTSGEVRTTQYGYTADGLLETIDGPRDDISDMTHFSYDEMGNLRSITNALGHITQITAYDPQGNPLITVDANGVETQYSYDDRQRLTSRNVDGAVTRLEYDIVGQLTKLTQADGAFITYEYDAAHRLIALQDNLGNRIEYTLDAMGNRSREVTLDPDSTLRKTQNRIFDELSRLKKIHGANGQVTEYEYDANGNRTAATETGLFSTLSQFDALNRLIKVTDANNGETIYNYDALDRLISVTDAKGLTTTYSYNAFDDLIEQNSPDTGVTTFGYDKAGNQVSQTDARGITVSHRYDALNRISFSDYPGNNEDVVYHYDGSNYSGPEAYGIGQLTGIVNSVENATRSFDSRGNLIRDMREIGSNVFTTRYQYDAANKLIRMSYPSGRVVNFEHGANGQVSMISSDSGKSSQPILISAQYFPFGPASKLVYGNGASSETGVDLDYRIASLETSDAKGQPLLSRTYAYDPRNNITAITDLIDAKQSQNYQYDALARLVGAHGSYGDIEYQYDVIGNRTSKTRNGMTDTYVYGTSTHRLESLNGSALTYDASGNQTSKDGLTMSYKAASRLTQVDDGGKAAYSAGYNPLGQRSTKTAGKTTQIFIYDQGGQLIAEGDHKRGIQNEYVYLNGQPIAFFERNKPYFIHTDHLGTALGLTDLRGKLAWTAEYLPFGQATPGSKNPEFNLRFPGQYFDKESGSHYNYFRDYDPEVGRYAQPDPIGVMGHQRFGGRFAELLGPTSPSGLNHLYAYTESNPLRYIDPLGLYGIGGGYGITPIVDITPPEVDDTPNATLCYFKCLADILIDEPEVQLVDKEIIDRLADLAKHHAKNALFLYKFFPLSKCVSECAIEQQFCEAGK